MLINEERAATSLFAQKGDLSSAAERTLVFQQPYYLHDKDYVVFSQIYTT